MNRIEKAIDIFLDALNNGALIKGSCAHCAVGNLVNHNSSDLYTRWSSVFCTINGIQTIDLTQLADIERVVNSTDFTLTELMQIEYEFETNTTIEHFRYFGNCKLEIREDQLRGLRAVIAVMETFEKFPNNYVEEFNVKAVLCFKNK